MNLSAVCIHIALIEVVSALKLTVFCFVPQTRVNTQGQAGQTAQVTLTKPPVVSVPAVVSSAGVTLPVSVAGISVAIGQAQKTGVSKVLIFFC